MAYDDDTPIEGEANADTNADTNADAQQGGIPPQQPDDKGGQQEGVISGFLRHGPGGISRSIAGGANQAAGAVSDTVTDAFNQPGGVPPPASQDNNQPTAIDQSVDALSRGGTRAGRALNPMTFHDNAKRILDWGLQKFPDMMRYLQGADAAPPPIHAAVKHNVDPNSELPPHESNQQQVAAAGQIAQQRGADPQAAQYGILQAQRRAYEVARIATRSAFEAGDIQGTVDGLNKAFQQGPWEATPQFVQGPNGTVTATVAGSPPVNLTRDQVKELVAGRTGLFDNVLRNGVVTALNPTQEPAPSYTRQTPTAAQAGTQPGQGATGQPSYLPTDDQLKKQAERIFPNINIAAAGTVNAQREKWIYDQQMKRAGMLQQLENTKLLVAGRSDVASQQAGARVSSAALREQGYVMGWAQRSDAMRDVANIHATMENNKITQQTKSAMDLLMQKLAASHQDTAIKSDAQVMRGIIANAVPGTPITDIIQQFRAANLDTSWLTGVGATTTPQQQQPPDDVRAKHPEATNWRQVPVLDANKNPVKNKDGSPQLKWQWQ